MPDRLVRTVVVTSVSVHLLDAEIAERQQYLRDQERIITGIINDGNNTLLNLNYEIERAKKELKATKAKLYELASERYTAEQDLQQLKEDIKAELKQAGMYLSFGV